MKSPCSSRARMIGLAYRTEGEELDAGCWGFVAMPGFTAPIRRKRGVKAFEKGQLPLLLACVSPVYGAWMAGGPSQPKAACPSSLQLRGDRVHQRPSAVTVHEKPSAVFVNARPSTAILPSRFWLTIPWYLADAFNSSKGLITLTDRSTGRPCGFQFHPRCFTG